jgi:hypothetical protein
VTEFVQDSYELRVSSSGRSTMILGVCDLVSLVEFLCCKSIKTSTDRLKILAWRDFYCENKE